MSDVNIYLLGSGIYSVVQFTQETIQALKSCKKVFILHDDTMIHKYVEQYVPEVIDLVNVYNNKKLRVDAYHEISEMLIEEAKKTFPIGFLVHGHPLFLVSATEYTLELAKKEGLNVQMIPGISSFDTILCDLGIDYGYGLQMFDSTTMLVNKWVPNPEIPVLIFQISTTHNPEVVWTEPKIETLNALVIHLKKAYPPTHPVKIIHSASHLLEKTEIINTTLDTLLSTDSIQLWKRPTLYVPPIDK